MQFCNLLFLGLLLLLLTGIDAAQHQHRHCPADNAESLNNAIERCLRSHTAHMQVIHQTESNFFGGIDVETIRTMCSHFKTSMHCVRSIQNACPESRHHAIDVALRPYLSMFDMCYFEGRSFIEDYAMSQNCLYSQRSRSEDCYKVFLINTANHQYYASRDNLVAVSAYCRSLSELTGCVRTNIVRHCKSSSPSAGPLVDVLVPASFELSYKCSDFDAAQATTPAVKSSRLQSVASDGPLRAAAGWSSLSASSSSSSVDRLLYCTVFTCLALLVRALSDRMRLHHDT